MACLSCLSQIVHSLEHTVVSIAGKQRAGLSDNVHLSCFSSADVVAGRCIPITAADIRLTPLFSWTTRQCKVNQEEVGLAVE